MLFSKEIEPRCAYCKQGAALDGEHMICIRKGIVSPGGRCRAFRYDPLKRVPPKPAALRLAQFDQEDFSL